MGRSINNASHDQAYNFLIGEWAKNPKLTEQKLADLRQVPSVRWL